MFITAQIIGAFALLIAAYSFQRNSQKGILFYQSISTIIFTVHFFMLGAYTGSALNCLSAFRNIVFYNNAKKQADSKIWIALFCLLYIAAGILTYKNIFSLFPVIAAVLQTFVFIIENPKYIRRLTLPCSILWIIYNAINLSFAGIITEILVISSIIIGMVRFDIKNKRL